jgi:hypothetical protein
MIAFLISRPMKRVGLILPPAIHAHANEVIEQLRSWHAPSDQTRLFVPTEMAGSSASAILQPE